MFSAPVHQYLFIKSAFLECIINKLAADKVMLSA
jgi:hypothetical protein